MYFSRWSYLSQILIVISTNQELTQFISLHLSQFMLVWRRTESNELAVLFLCLIKLTRIILREMRQYNYIQLWKLRYSDSLSGVVLLSEKVTRRLHFGLTNSKRFFPATCVKPSAFWHILPIQKYILKAIIRVCICSLWWSSPCGLYSYSGFGFRWKKSTFQDVAAAAVCFLKCVNIHRASKVTVWSNVWTLTNYVLKSVQANVLTFELLQGKFVSYTWFQCVEMGLYTRLYWAQIDLFLFLVLFSSWNGNRCP